jgi:hypothetical protein
MHCRVIKISWSVAKGTGNKGTVQGQEGARVDLRTRGPQKACVQLHPIRFQRPLGHRPFRPPSPQLRTAIAALCSLPLPCQFPSHLENLTAPAATRYRRDFTRAFPLANHYPIPASHTCRGRHADPRSYAALWGMQDASSLPFRVQRAAFSIALPCPKNDI